MLFNVTGTNILYMMLSVGKGKLDFAQLALKIILNIYIALFFGVTQSAASWVDRIGKDVSH